MEKGFALGITAGRLAFHAGAMEARDMAVPSTPVLGLAFSES
jgi:thiazole synthase